MGLLEWGKGKRRKRGCPRRFQTAAERLSSCLTCQSLRFWSILIRMRSAHS